MTKLPEVRPKDVLKALQKAGFIQTNSRGSHVDLHHPDCHRTTVPVHNKSLFKGTFHKILKQSGLSYEQLKKLM